MKKSLLIPLLLFCVNIHAQKRKDVEINLAKLDTGTLHSFPIPSGDILEFTLVNALTNPEANYTLQVAYSFSAPPPLPDLNRVKDDQTGCEALDPEIRQRLDKVLLEKNMPDSIKKIAGDADSCKNHVNALCEELTTRHIPFPVEVKPGNKITVTIKRRLNNTEMRWNIEYVPATQGQWITTYGYGFSPSLFFPVAEYYPKPDTGSTFLITKKKNHSGLNLAYVPAIFVQYIPYRQAFKPWAHSWTAGLGVNSKEPVLLLGYSAIYHYNIGISLGVVAGSKSVLRGEYEENQRIKENLTADQLTERKIFPELYISVFFRFGKSPFETEDEE